MQFIHPEILWALFLTLIPILIHLFKLRKYQKETFTNVQVLKQIRKQTNKQSQIKKWLILLMRILSITCIVLAFSEPYFSNRDHLQNEVETVIYIDNSFSMELQGSKGPLLQEAVNDVLQHFPQRQTLSLFTNTDTYKNTTIEELKNSLITTPYSATQLSIDAIYLMAEQLFSKEQSSKNFIIISDFQERVLKADSPAEINSHFVPLYPMAITNTTIDSAFIASKNPDQFEIKVELQSTDDQPTVPVSLYNQGSLYAKTSAEFKNGQATVSFTVLEELKNGLIQINDKGMLYDNSLYFSLHKSQYINVLSINGAEDDFLKRIYTPDEFNYNSSSLEQLDYNSIDKQNFIVLNQLSTIPQPLKSALLEASKKGVKICVIPDQTNHYLNQGPLFSFLGNVKFTQKNNTEKRISTIVYQHPLFADVFEKSVTNFQYPKATNSFEAQGSYQSVLGFSDGSEFLLEVDGHYAFTAPLSTSNSNFQSTPLIVPVFYNMAQQSLTSPTLYYNLNHINTIDINTHLEQDQVLSVVKDGVSFIPMQMNYQQYVSIVTGEHPKDQGTYTVKNNTDELLTLSFNHPRIESSTKYLSKDHFPEDRTLKNATQAIKVIKSENNVHELWKWFAIFALIFLCLEFLILKYYR